MGLAAEILSVTATVATMARAWTAAATLASLKMRIEMGKRKPVGTATTMSLSRQAIEAAVKPSVLVMMVVMFDPLNREHDAITLYTGPRSPLLVTKQNAI